MLDLPTSLTTSRSSLMRNRVLIIAVLAGLALAAVGVTWFLGRDSIGAVDIERALADAAAADQAQAPTGDGDAATAAGAITDATGAWTVDTTLVAFDSVSGAGSWVGYRIDEELSGVGAFTAVGRSPRVEGEVVIDGSEVLSATIRADLQGLVSDNANRDARVRPIFSDRPVTFTLSDPVDFGAVPSEGQRITVTARGVLRIGGIERDVEVELSADVAGSRLVITGSTVITLADFGVSVPSAPVVLSVSDDATIELQLFLTRS
jgi:polyisoprenoid-binding protein YceI